MHTAMLSSALANLCDHAVFSGNLVSRMTRLFTFWLVCTRPCGMHRAFRVSCSFFQLTQDVVKVIWHMLL